MEEMKDKKYKNETEAIRDMTLLVNFAYDISDTNNTELKRLVQDEYSLVRDVALALGGNLDNFPKRINYTRIERILTPEEKLMRSDLKARVISRRMWDGISNRYEQMHREHNSRMAFYKKLQEQLMT